MAEELQNKTDIPADTGSDNTDNNDTNLGRTNRVRDTLSVEYEANVLDDYDSVTYHFRLFMMSPEGIKEMKIDNAGQAKRVMIAESGATTIGIDDVSLTTFPTPSARNRFGTSTAVQFTLQQALGADLVDKIFAASKRLGIEQFSKIPFFLELSFRGREPDRTLGGSLIPGAFQDALLGDDSLSDVVWVWPITLRTMTMVVDSGGSTYTINAMTDSDASFTNQVSDIKKTVSFHAATVKEAFTELEKHLASYEESKEKETGTQAVQDKFKFFIDSEFANSKLVPDSPADVGEAGVLNTEIPDKAPFSYEPGTSIEKIAEDIMSRSVELQRSARGVKDENSISEKGNKEKGIEQRIYRIYGQRYLGEFDKIRNDYSRSYMYAIVPYSMTTINTRTSKDATVSSQQRYDFIRRKGRLRKAYNYIYSGLNDQVFDFDIALNFSWYAVDNILGGKDINARHDPKGTVSEEQQEDEEKKADPQSWAEKLGLDPDSFGGELVEDFEDFVVEGGIDGAVEGIFTGDFDQLTGATSEFVAEQVTKGTRLGLGKLSPYLTQSQLQEREQLLEEEEPNEKASNALQSMTTYLESPIDKQHDVSGGDVKNPGKILLSQIFDQATSPVSRDLISISLRVKGDPYWLSPGAIGRGERFKTLFDEALAKYGVAINPYDPNGGVETIDATDNTEVTSADIALNEQLFLFRLFTPLEPEADTGIVKGLGKNNTISGIYMARVIEHNWSGGQYTQTIDAVRNTFISLDDVDLGLGVADDRGVFEQWAGEGAFPWTIEEGTFDADANAAAAARDRANWNPSSGTPPEGDFLDEAGGSQYGVIPPGYPGAGGTGA